MESIWRLAPFAVVCVALLLGLGVVPHVSHAQNSQQDFLDAHNSARANVGVGALIWDDTVASYAQDYANQRAADCALQHSGTGQYGENILAGGTGDYSAVYAVNRWVSEGSYYDYNSNTCSAATCGHYTQVVWRDSKNLGCEKVTCDNGGTFITCNYDPPGNIDGQRPY